MGAKNLITLSIRQFLGILAIVLVFFVSGVISGVHSNKRADETEKKIEALDSKFDERIKLLESKIESLVSVVESQNQLLKEKTEVKAQAIYACNISSENSDSLPQREVEYKYFLLPPSEEKKVSGSKHRFYGMMGYGISGGTIKSDGTYAWSEPKRGLLGGGGYMFTPKDSNFNYGLYYTGAEQIGFTFGYEFELK